ncbi:hypothetical protein ANCCEY_06814 [Ancylostoma ceylanicum]|uniref:Uncharacterized protein n=1 Tax=Ancylostoma ceylanicum TaxID=53326 RepID=A0A0D6M2F8_9BILA|nr:hypothetical protein ANCCEY_06814 [Ancylostoma ceylanicum]
MLSQSSLPKRNPLSTRFEQCSILRRMSSTCPVDGIVFCDAADDTNPALMQVEFFNAAGNVVRTVSNTGRSLAVNVRFPIHHKKNCTSDLIRAFMIKVFCRKGVWTVASSDTSSATFLPISSVSCAQTGSTGADKGYIIGQAVN